MRARTDSGRRSSGLMFLPAIALLIGALAFAGGSRPARRGTPVLPPLLQTIDALMESGPTSSTPFNDAWPSFVDRGVTLGGVVCRGDAWGLPLGADPRGIDVCARRSFRNIDLASGAVHWEESHIALPAIIPWPIGIAYSTGQADSATAAPGSGFPDGAQGCGWFQTSRPELVAGKDVIYLVYGPDRFAEYQVLAENENVFVGVNGAAGLIELSEQGGVPIATLRFTNGWNVKFFGFDDEATVVAGQLWSIENAPSTAEAADKAYVGDSTNAATAITAGFSSGRITQAFDSAGRRFTYSYTSSIGDKVRLKRVIAEHQISSAWVELERVEYSYYGEDGSAIEESTEGTAGDLGLVEITVKGQVYVGTTATPDQHFRNYFRYWTSNSDGGRTHGLKYALGFEGTRQAFAALSDLAGLDGATDATLRPYAALGASYDSGLAASAIFDGIDKTAGSAWGTHQFTFATTAGTTADYEPAPLRRAVVKLPDSAGSTESEAGQLRVTQYFDEVGQPLSTVLTDGDPATASARWCHRAVRDVEGRLERIASPDNATGYDHSTSTITPSNDVGVVTVIDREPGTGRGRARARMNAGRRSSVRADRRAAASLSRRALASRRMWRKIGPR